MGRYLFILSWELSESFVGNVCKKWHSCVAEWLTVDEFPMALVSIVTAEEKSKRRLENEGESRVIEI